MKSELSIRVISPTAVKMLPKYLTILWDKATEMVPAVELDEWHYRPPK